MAKPVRVKGKLFFTKFLHTFNTHFNEDSKKYECTVGCISDEAQAELKEKLNIKPKNKEGLDNYFCAKSTFLFDPVDEDGNGIDPRIIGTGTEVIAHVTHYTHPMVKMHGMAPSIKKLIVTKLVKYETAENVEQQDEFDPVL